MNRLQKKCVIAIVGIHLLLLTALFCSGFVASKPKPDDTQVLEIIPSVLIDAPGNSGKRDATPPPPPVSVPQPQQQQQPTPPAPKSVEPTPSLMDKVEKLFKSEPKPEPVKTTPKPVVNDPHKIQVNTQLTTRVAPKKSDNNSRQTATALNSALNTLEKSLSKGAEIDMPGNSSESYANYASVVQSVYDAAWILPNTIAENENIKVTVTIARDGTVISSRIVTPSGDTPADASVQKALDRVTFVRAFPEGATDKERTYTIIFNPQVKNSE